MTELADPLLFNEDEKEFTDLKVFIKKKIGFNCDQYKENHLKRRLAVRLRANNSSSYKEYADTLARNETELWKLKEALTVNVTEMFRNPETYEAFRNIALPGLIKAKEKNRSIRIWSAGCSDGEEPYSIAMLLLEFLGFSLKKYDISILGTDIDEDSLKKAKMGIYKSKQLEKISKERIGKFFTMIDSTQYEINDKIKGFVRFRQHDLISGPQLNGFDTIFCRNVTIYFEQKLQEKLYLRFYHALNTGGYFVMGKTETLVGEAATLFKSVDLKERIYQK